jgi:hypothetical protein
MNRSLAVALAVALVSPCALAGDHGHDHSKPSVRTSPPVVVKTVPRAGDTAVDSKTTEIRATFSKDMKTNKMWSFVQESKATFPVSTGKPRYLADKRTIVLPVKLQPGNTYIVWFNKGKFNAFRDAQGHPAVPYLLVFETKK